MHQTVAIPPRPPLPHDPYIPITLTETRPEVPHFTIVFVRSSKVKAKGDKTGEGKARKDKERKEREKKYNAAPCFKSRGHVIIRIDVEVALRSSRNKASTLFEKAEIPLSTREVLRA